MTHFLQSPAWAAFQEALGRTVVRDQGDDWSYQAILEVGRGNRRLYAPYGPACISPATFDAAITSLTKAGRVARATFLRIEPTAGITASDLHARGFLPVTYNQLQPAHTQIIDLTTTPEELLQHMSQNSRNLTRNYAKKGITIHTSRTPEDISILLQLLHAVADRNNIRPHSDDYFRMQAQTLFPLAAATLYYASFEGVPIASALVYDSADTRYYAHAAADDSYRKLSAGTALLGQMILDAQTAGLQHFDLYGIAPTDDPTHPWAGFSKFKQSFGGQPVTFAGAWDLPLRPLAYRLYRLNQQLAKRRR